MAQAPKDSGNSSADFVQQVVKDPANVPDVMRLYGYPGDSSEQGHERLYLNPDLSSFVEIPTSAALHRISVPAAQDPHGAVVLWVRRDAPLVYKMGPAAQALAHYFAGAIQAPAAAAAAMPAAAPGAQAYTVLCAPTSPVPCQQTAPIVCQHTAQVYCPYTVAFYCPNTLAPPCGYHHTLPPVCVYTVAYCPPTLPPGCGASPGPFCGGPVGSIACPSAACGVGGGVGPQQAALLFRPGGGPAYTPGCGTPACPTALCTVGHACPGGPHPAALLYRVGEPGPGGSVGCPSVACTPICPTALCTTGCHGSAWCPW